MSFNLSGYKPEAPADSNFEAFKYNGKATIEEAKITINEKVNSEFYPKGCHQFELEVTCMEDKPFKGNQTIGRKLWKRFNIDDVSLDKKGKTSAMKLADQLSGLNITFSNEEELKAACSKLKGLDISIKAWPADFKDGRDPVQMFNIKGLWNGAASSNSSSPF